jgi:D-3-phosphoglycerate dehydrogenase
MYKVLITDISTALLQEGLKNLGFEVVNKPDVDQDYVNRHIHEYEGIIVRSKITLFEDTLKNAQKLKFIGRPGSGLDLIDLEYCRKKGIAVCRSATSNSNAVAEHALGMLLAWMNKLVRSDNEVKKMVWRREANRGFEIMGKTVGIIGFGNTGSRFAKKMQGLDVKVLAYDKYKKDYTKEYPHVRESNLAEICAKADIISFHLPLNIETKYFLNTDLIEAFSKPVIVINTSRGPIVDTRALLKGLESGRLRGACLDVLENESPSKYIGSELDMYKSLFAMDKVLLSPHVAGWSATSKIQMESFLLDEIKEIANI